MFNDVIDGGPASQTITEAPRPRVEGLPEEFRARVISISYASGLCSFLRSIPR